MKLPANLTSQGLDWTLETVATQVGHGFLLAHPEAEPGDPWDLRTMQEYLDLAAAGLPLGQVSCVELSERRGGPRKKAMVDGIERVAAVALFMGVRPGWAPGGPVGFPLGEGPFRPDLAGLTYADMGARPDLRGDLDSLMNATMSIVTLVNFPPKMAGMLRAQLNPGRRSQPSPGIRP
jgi:hypothetical protein